MDRLTELLLIIIPTALLGLLVGRQSLRRRLDGLRQQTHTARSQAAEAAARDDGRSSTDGISDADLIRRVAAGELDDIKSKPD
jgi:hypothetical protein